jgi:uncharacterized repeat protein (TIGR01451 family)
MNPTSQQKLSKYAVQLSLMLATVIGGSIFTTQSSQALTHHPSGNTAATMNSGITVAINKTGVTDTVEDGKTYTYTLTPKITASKCSTARKVIISETLPTFLTYQAGSSKIAPQITKNHDGTTTLTWNLGDVSTHAAIPTITYSAIAKNCNCMSDRAVDTAVDKVVISSTDDLRAESLRSYQNNVGCTATVTKRAKVLLVKRITAINTTKFTNVIVTDSTNNDANRYWPTNYIQGGGIATQNDPVQHSKVKPGDELEYTVYFLNAGNGGAKKVRVCDLLTAHQTYVPGVSLTIGSGVNKMTGSSSQIQYIPAGGAIPSGCGIQNGNNINGLVVIDVNSDKFPTLPGAAVQPGLAYGAISFRTKIN